MRGEVNSSHLSCKRHLMQLINVIPHRTKQCLTKVTKFFDENFVRRKIMSTKILPKVKEACIFRLFTKQERRNLLKGDEMSDE